MRFMAVWWVMSMVLLGGCASTPVSYSSNTLNASPLTTFEVDGRLVVHSVHKSGQLGFHWTHHPSDDVVTFYSPLGQTLAVLTLNVTGASLVDGSGKVQHADSMETLSDKSLGWTFPLAELSYWIVGAADPNETFIIGRDEAHPEQLQLSQSGWVVTYLRWRQQGHRNLPDKLSFLGAGVSARLVVSHWGEAK